MPRYFVDTDDGRVKMTDVEGYDVDDADVARKMALAALPEMARDFLALENCDDGCHLAVTVRSEVGDTIFSARMDIEQRWSGVPPR